MYEGYATIGGIEVINNHRTAEYARRAGLNWMLPCSTCASISAAVGGPWSSPYQDRVRPPWWREHVADSHRFYGLYGLSVSGTETDTRDVPVMEYLRSGGWFGMSRRKVREMVFRVLVVAADGAALEYGLAWLRGVDHSLSGCTVSAMDMYATCPCVCAPDCDSKTCAGICADRYRRRYRRVRIVSGPTVIRIPDMTVGAVAEVEFVAVAGDPDIYEAVATAAVAGQGPFEFGTIDAPVTELLPLGSPLRKVRMPSPAPMFSAVGLLMGEPILPMNVPVLWDQRAHPFVISSMTVGGRVWPNVILTNGPMEQTISLELRDASKATVGEMLLFGVRPHEEIGVDYSSRTVWRRFSGVGEGSVDLSFIARDDGGPVLWPNSFHSGPGSFSVGVPAGGSSPRVDLSPLVVVEA